MSCHWTTPQGEHRRLMRPPGRLAPAQGATAVLAPSLHDIRVLLLQGFSHSGGISSRLLRKPRRRGGRLRALLRGRRRSARARTRPPAGGGARAVPGGAPAPDDAERAGGRRGDAVPGRRERAAATCARCAPTPNSARVAAARCRRWCAATTSPTSAPAGRRRCRSSAPRATRSAHPASSIGQNLAWGTDGWATPAHIVAAWMASPPHRAIMLDERIPRRRGRATPAVPAVVGEGRAGATYAIEFGVRPLRRRQARLPERRGTRPPSAPASVAGPAAEAMPSTRIAFRPRLSFSRPSLELTSRPDSSRTRSSR